MNLGKLIILYIYIYTLHYSHIQLSFIIQHHGILESSDLLKGLAGRK
jgi:hypothetical protein